MTKNIEKNASKYFTTIFSYLLAKKNYLTKIKNKNKLKPDEINKIKSRVITTNSKRMAQRVKFKKRLQ